MMQPEKFIALAYNDRMNETILLVEDNPHDLELTLIALDRCKLANRVVVARDGAEALDYLLAKGQYAGRPPGNPALILLDLKLPKIDGVEVLKTIRFTPFLVDVPVVILSASNLEADLNRTQSFGISSYLVKPMEWTNFSQVLCQSLPLKANADLKSTA